MVHPSAASTRPARPCLRSVRRPRVRVYPQITSWGALNEGARRDSLPAPPPPSDTRIGTSSACQPSDVNKRVTFSQTGRSNKSRDVNCEGRVAALPEALSDCDSSLRYGQCHLCCVQRDVRLARTVPLERLRRGGPYWQQPSCGSEGSSLPGPSTSVPPHTTRTTHLPSKEFSACCANQTPLPAGRTLLSSQQEEVIRATANQRQHVKSCTSRMTPFPSYNNLPYRHHTQQQHYYHHKADSNPYATATAFPKFSSISRASSNFSPNCCRGPPCNKQPNTNNNNSQRVSALPAGCRVAGTLDPDASGRTLNTLRDTDGSFVHKVHAGNVPFQNGSQADRSAQRLATAPTVQPGDASNSYLLPASFDKSSSASAAIARSGGCSSGMLQALHSDLLSEERCMPHNNAPVGYTISVPYSESYLTLDDSGDSDLTELTHSNTLKRSYTFSLGPPQSASTPTPDSDSAHSMSNFSPGIVTPAVPTHNAQFDYSPTLHITNPTLNPGHSSVPVDALNSSGFKDYSPVAANCKRFKSRAGADVRFDQKLRYGRLLTDDDVKECRLVSCLVQHGQKQSPGRSSTTSSSARLSRELDGFLTRDVSPARDIEEGAWFLQTQYANNSNTKSSKSSAATALHREKEKYTAALNTGSVTVEGAAASTGSQRCTSVASQYQKGTKRGKFVAKKSPKEDDGRESVANSSHLRSAASGLDSVSTTTVSSLATVNSISSTSSSAIPLAKGSADSRKFTAEAAKRLSEGRRPATRSSDGKRTENGGSRGRTTSGGGGDRGCEEASAGTRLRSISGNAGSSKRYTAGLQATFTKSRTSATPNGRPEVAAARKNLLKEAASPDVKQQSGVRQAPAEVTRAGGNVGPRSGGRTATVTPSEVVLNKRPAAANKRFGFIDSPTIKSGESTDSLNSILSDALTSPDSNALEFYDDSNASNRSSKIKECGVGGIDTGDLVKNLRNLKAADGSDSRRSSRRSGSSSHCDDIVVHSSSSLRSPTTISQASSGVTSASNAITAKLRAHTRQLPQMQQASLKSCPAAYRSSVCVTSGRKTTAANENEAVQGNIKRRPRTMSADIVCGPDRPTSAFQPQKSQKSTPKVALCPVTFKAVTNAAASKSYATTPSPVEDKDSNSPKSISTLDSGLGSSMEGDKLKAATADDKPLDDSDRDSHTEENNNKPEAGLKERIFLNNHKELSLNKFGTRCADVRSSTNESLEQPFVPLNEKEGSLKTSLIDESDKWLREKKNNMGSCSKLQTGSNLKPSNIAVGYGRFSTSHSKLNKSEETVAAAATLPECPQTYITYEAARDKFEAIQRSRFGFHSSATCFNSENSILEKSKLIKSPSDPGKKYVVPLRSPNSKLARVHSVPVTKSCNIRPTSLNKTPILVTPVSNETVEISKPILKKLEYSENALDRYANGSDTAIVERVRHRKNSAEDLLMVSCMEVQVKESIVKNCHADKNFVSKSSSPDSSRRDIEFNKKLNHKTSGFSYNILNSPDSDIDTDDKAKIDAFCLKSPSVPSTCAAKMLTPDSESSFEVLDSPPSEGLEYSACTTALCQQSFPYSASAKNKRYPNSAFDYQCPLDKGKQHSIFSDEFSCELTERVAEGEGSAAASSNIIEDGTAGAFHSMVYPSENNAQDDCTAAQMDRLMSSLENSFLVESLTNAVMTESLNASFASSGKSSDILGEGAYTKDPSSFYSITAGAAGSSNDLQQHLRGVGSERLSGEPGVQETQSNAEVITNFMNNLNTSKMEIVEMLNNFSFKSNTGYTNKNMPYSTDENYNSNVNSSSVLADANKIDLSSILCEPNQNLIHESMTSAIPAAHAINSTELSSAADESHLDGVQEEPFAESSAWLSSSCTFSDASPILRQGLTKRDAETESNRYSNVTSNSTATSQLDSNNGNTNSNSGGDMDHDFLIDDEISDQPDLTFAGDEVCAETHQNDLASYLTTEGYSSGCRDYRYRAAAGERQQLYSSTGRDGKYGRRSRSAAHDQPESGEDSGDAEKHEEVDEKDGLMSSVFSDEGICGDEAPSPCFAVRRVGTAVSSAPLSRATPPCAASRPSSVCTLASSLDPDDFMLDFDAEDLGTPRDRCSTPPCAASGTNSLRSVGLASGHNSNHCSPHHSHGGTGHAGLKRPLGSLMRGEGGKPTRLPMLKQQSDGELRAALPAIDVTLQQQIVQDCHGAKTLLLQLRNVLLNADTTIPFALTSKASDGVSEMSPEESEATTITALQQQNVDLRRQVFLLQQQLEERDRTVRNLQRRLSPGLPSSSVMTRSLGSTADRRNSATQTERTGRPLTASSALARHPSLDDGLGPTVSSEETSPLGDSCSRPATPCPADRLAPDEAVATAAPRDTHATSTTNGTFSAPNGTCSALDGSRSALDGTCSALDGTCSAPDGTSTLGLRSGDGGGTRTDPKCSNDEESILRCSPVLAALVCGAPRSNSSSPRCRHSSDDSLLSVSSAASDNSGGSATVINHNSLYNKRDSSLSNGISCKRDTSLNRRNVSLNRPDVVQCKRDFGLIKRDSSLNRRDLNITRRDTGLCNSSHWIRRGSECQQQDAAFKSFQERKEMFAAVARTMPHNSFGARQPS